MTMDARADRTYPGRSIGKWLLFAVLTLFLPLDSAIACPVFDSGFAITTWVDGKGQRLRLPVETKFQKNGEMTYRISKDEDFYPPDNIFRPRETETGAQGNIRFRCSGNSLTYEVFDDRSRTVAFTEITKLNDKRLCVKTRPDGPCGIFQR